MPNRNRKKNHKGPSKNEMRNIAADYGWAMSVFEEIPQLNQIFKDAIKKEWSPQRFIAEIQDTNWFKNHSDAWRQATYLRITDPKTYHKRVTEIAEQIGDAAGALGIEPGRAQINEWAEQAFKFGWAQGKINNVLSRSVSITGNHTVGGSLAETQNNLESLAFNNGVNISTPTMQGWLRQIVRGNSTQQEYEQYIKKMAIAKHPNWKSEIESGMTVSQLAEPYRQSMAQMLEMNPAAISLNSKRLRQAMSYKNDKGEWQSMSMGDFEDQLRKDPRWQYTDNARQTVNNVTASLLQTFGEFA